jgi:hypothetical protein
MARGYWRGKASREHEPYLDPAVRQQLTEGPRLSPADSDGRRAIERGSNFGPLGRPAPVGGISHRARRVKLANAKPFTLRPFGGRERLFRPTGGFDGLRRVEQGTRRQDISILLCCYSKPLWPFRSRYSRSASM